MWWALSLTVHGDVGNVKFDYVHHGQDWTQGECLRRERQSPIDFDMFAPWKRTPDGSFFVSYEPFDGFS